MKAIEYFVCRSVGFCKLMKLRIHVVIGGGTARALVPSLKTMQEGSKLMKKVIKIMGYYG